MHKYPENPGKKLQIATDTKSKRGQITLQGDEPFCICWQELASVFRCNILSVAEEPLRKNVAGKSSKRRQSQVCKMWKWAGVRLPPLSKTYSVRSELSEVQNWFRFGRHKSHLSLRLLWSFPNSSLHLRLPGGLDGNLWSLLLLLGWLGISPDVPQLACVWRFWHCLGEIENWQRSAWAEESELILRGAFTDTTLLNGSERQDNTSLFLASLPWSSTHMLRWDCQSPDSWHDDTHTHISRAYFSN